MKKPTNYFLFRQWLKFFNFGAVTSIAFLLQAQAGTYDSWIASKGLGNSESTADPDHDGVPNIMEFVIDSEPNPARAGSSSTTLLPTCTSVDGDLTLVLKRNVESRSSVNLYLQWSTDLSFNYIQSVWIGPVSTITDGVVINIAANTPNAATDTVTIKVPAAKAAGKKLYGRLQAYVSTPAKNSKLGGYLTFPATGIVEPYNAGFSMYTAAWPIVDTYPGHEFQTGLFGTWMYPKQLTKPPQEFNSNVEGGLGWWGDTRFPTLTPKFIMGPVAQGFAAVAHGPSFGTGSYGIYAVAQLSPRLLFPMDGLNLKQGTNGELFGYGYHPLPFTKAKTTTAGVNVPTGDHSWTLFLNTSNFKGPVAFILPYFWTHVAVENPIWSDFLLDKRGTDPSRPYAMETQRIPSKTATGTNGEQYARCAPVYFPRNSGADSILMHRVTNYSKQALWDGVKAWFEGTGPAVTGSFKPAGSLVMDFTNSLNPTWGMVAEDARSQDDNLRLDLDAFATRIVSSDSKSFGFKWNSASTTTVGSNVVIPQYFRRVRTAGNDRWLPSTAAEAPAGLKAVEFTRPLEAKPAPHETPEAPTSSFKTPGPVAGPFKAYLGDNSIVTYYWYRFADQPALLNADLTTAEREEMQLKVVKLHQNWTKDLEYLSPPTVGTLAALDPAQIVTPPPGLEVGYVPIPTRQEWDPTIPYPPAGVPTP
jgi:hypothetical protein